MKTLRFLFVVTVMFALFATPAQAKGEDVGYIPLLSKVDSSIPVRVQMQEAYDKLLPVLLSAQKNGSILEFQPEFAVGAVRVKFAAGARPAMLGGMKVFENLREAKDLMPRPSLPEQNGTRAYNPHFDIGLYSSCPYLYGLVEGDHVVGSLRDKNGKILAVYDDYADAYGEAWYSCFEGNSNVMPSHKITYKVYSAAGVLRGTYWVIAPSISFTALDNANSVASGKGPAGKTYYAYWYHRNLNAANTYLYVWNTGTTSGAGNWTTDFGTTKFRGGDSIDIYVSQTARFTFTRSMSVPYSYCYLDYNYCGLYGFANQAASMTVTHSGTPYTYTGKFSPWGSFGASITDNVTNLPVFLAAGDTFNGTGIPAYSLPNLTANVDYGTDVISGQAPANRNFQVCIGDMYLYSWYCDWVHSDGSGNYSADFAWAWDLKDTDVFIASISYHNPITGNRTYLDQPFGP